MAFVILLIACIAMMTSGYAPPPGTDGNYYPSYKEDNDYYQSPKRDFRKLKDLDGTDIFKADVKYYYDKDDIYAIITCKPDPTHKLVWLLTTTGETQHPNVENFVVGTIALAGATDVTFAAKYGRSGKWTGRDYYEHKMRKFRRVGCFFSTTDLSIDQKVN